MLIQFTNIALLLLTSLLSITGLVVLFWQGLPLAMDIHRWAGWTLLVLIPWKGIIIYRSLARGLRKSFDRGLMPILSSLMAGFLILLLAAGLAWTWRIGDWLVLLGQTVISWHWVLGLAILPLFLLHIWHRWPNPSSHFLLSRRAALRSLAAAGFGVLGWRAADWLAEKRESEQHKRSPSTGSRQYRSFSGNAMPVTTNVGEDPRHLDPVHWRLSIDGWVEDPLEFRYQQLLRLPPKVMTVPLDCTVGWYSIQKWRGIPLMELVNRTGPASQANFLRLWSDTGYNKSFSIREAENILLATHLGGEILSHDHGYPVRAVVPGWRGWFWVKWVRRIEVVSRPAA